MLIEDAFKISDIIEDTDRQYVAWKYADGIVRLHRRFSDDITTHHVSDAKIGMIEWQPLSALLEPYEIDGPDLICPVLLTGSKGRQQYAVARRFAQYISLHEGHAETHVPKDVFPAPFKSIYKLRVPKGQPVVETLTEAVIEVIKTCTVDAPGFATKLQETIRKYVNVPLGGPKSIVPVWPTATEEYRAAYVACPDCGSSNVSVTCVGIFGDRATNDAACGCGWRGIVHDLVPEVL